MPVPRIGAKERTALLTVNAMALMVPKVFALGATSFMQSCTQAIHKSEVIAGRRNKILTKGHRNSASNDTGERHEDPERDVPTNTKHLVQKNGTYHEQWPDTDADTHHGSSTIALL